FLHIPFPSSEIFPILPRREELLQGLLGADLVAFQTHGHLQQFRSALLRVLGMESKVTEVAVDARPVRLEALPIGIAPDEYADLLSRAPAGICATTSILFGFPRKSGPHPNCRAHPGRN